MEDSMEDTEWMEQCYRDLPRLGLPTIQDLGEPCTLQVQEADLLPDDRGSLLLELQGTTEREKHLVQELKESHKRESALNNNLDSINSRLCYEVHQRKEREAELEELRTKLAIKRTQLDEKDLIIAEKERTILVLEEEKQALIEELRYVVNAVISILWSVSEQILHLTVDLQKFQFSNKYGPQTTPTPGTRPCEEMPTTRTLLSCAEHVAKKIVDAKYELAEAGKVWKKAKARLELMETYNRKHLLARILGKEEPDCDVGTVTL